MAHILYTVILHWAISLKCTLQRAIFQCYIQ